MAKDEDLTKYFFRHMDVLLNILYFSVYVKHFIPNQKKVKTKQQKTAFFVEFIFLPFFGNKIVQSSSGNVEFFPLHWNFCLNFELHSLNVEFSSLNLNSIVVHTV